MKTLPLITVSAAAAVLLVYYLFIKKENTFDDNSEGLIKSHPNEHHLTNVFAKAKQYATE